MLKHKKNNRQDKDMKYIVYKTYVIGLYGIHVKFREKNDCVLYLCTSVPSVLVPSRNFSTLYTLKKGSVPEF